MLNLRDLKIDNASQGQKKLLVEVVPAYEYKDKQRTDIPVTYTAQATSAGGSEVWWKLPTWRQIGRRPDLS